MTYAMAMVKNVDNTKHTAAIKRVFRNHRQ